MPSYQDIETRLAVVEDKIDLVLKSITMRQQVGLVDKKIVQYSLYDLYIASRNAGLTPTNPGPIEIVTEHGSGNETSAAPDAQ